MLCYAKMFHLKLPPLTWFENRRQYGVELLEIEDLRTLRIGIESTDAITTINEYNVTRLCRLYKAFV